MREMCKKGLITLAFDDGYQDTYKYAIDYLNRLNIKSTIAIPSGLIGKTFEKRPIVGLGELKNLVRYGHEIASHTLTHPNLLKLSRKSKKNPIYEIVEAKIKLESALPIKITSFVLPYIDKNESRSLRNIIKKHYSSLRLTKKIPCFNSIPLKSPYSLKGFAVMKKYSLPFLNRQIDYVQKNRCWLIEVFHLVSKKNTLSAHRPKPYRFFMHIDDFKRHIDYIKSKDVTILTQRDVVNRFG